MCFSAGVSFGASAVISVVGVAAFKKATSPAQNVLAGIPMFFAVQQAIEGFLWLSLQRADYQFLHSLSTYSFLILALVVWPIMIPFAAMLPEPEARRRKFLKILLGIGVTVSLFHLYGLLHFGASASANAHHIKYEFHFPPEMILVSKIIYFIPALVPAFISSVRAIRALGLALVGSYAFSWMFFHYHIISVWCFFATIISVIALIAIVALRKKPVEEAGTIAPAAPL